MNELDRIEALQAPVPAAAPAPAEAPAFDARASSDAVGRASKEHAAVRPRARRRSLWGDAARAFLHSKAGLVGLVVVALLLLVAVFAPLLAPYDPNAQDYYALMQGPSAAHLMGTDELGRDILSRVMLGIRTAVSVAVLITVVSGVIGVLVGAVAGMLGGVVDALIVWLIDALLTVPGLWLAAFISVATRPSVTNLAASIYAATGWSSFKDTVLIDYLVVVACLGVVSWPGLARIVRGQVLALREQQFVEAERALGASTWWTIRAHIVPNTLGSVIVALSAGFGYAMLFEASLSFLGIGIRPPGSSLGQMIADGIDRYRSAPHLVLMPGLVLVVVVLAFNFVGDALNDALNPKARRR